MARTTPPPLSLALNYLRLAQGWSQKELSDVMGLPASLLSDYERGRKTLSRERLESIAIAMGLPTGAVDTALGFLQTVRAASQEPAPLGSHNWRIEAVAAQSGRMMSDFTRSMLRLLTVEARALEARQQAEILWTRLKRHSAAQRRVFVEEVSEFRNWALCELLCEESIRVAGDSADRALDLANLALLVAELAPGEETWRSRLQGYAWAHVGNAWRVRSDLPGAEEAFVRSQKLWRAGAPGDSGLLDEARMLGLRSSLLRDQRKLAEAVEVLDQALILDKGRETKYLRLNQAKLFEEMDDFGKAVTVLRSTTALIESEGETRSLFVLKHNLAVSLCFLGQYGEVKEILPNLKKLATKLGNELDLLRVRWLEGRLLSGLGAKDEAIGALYSVREGLISRGLAYDAALVSLELAVIYLEGERTEEVKNLARQMASIFQLQGVHREALSALKIFRDAAERQTATLELTRRLVDYLRHAKNDPRSRFEYAV